MLFIEYWKIGFISARYFKIHAPKKAETKAGSPNLATILIFAYLPRIITLKILFIKWTIAVNEIEILSGKNTAKTGNKIVPKPNPENKVSNEAINEIIGKRKKSIYEYYRHFSMCYTFTDLNHKKYHFIDFEQHLLFFFLALFKFKMIQVPITKSIS